MSIKQQGRLSGCQYRIICWYFGATYVAWHYGLMTGTCCCHTIKEGQPLCLTCSYCSAGEVPLCDTSNSRCVITDPSKHSGLFCTSDTTSATDCQRYKEFHALYERGVDQYVRDTGTARKQANSVVFNTFIFMQVGRCMLLPLPAAQALNSLLSPAHSSCLLLDF